MVQVGEAAGRSRRDDIFGMLFVPGKNPQICLDLDFSTQNSERRGSGGGGGERKSPENSMIIFHAESVKVPVNCTLTSVSESEAVLPEELAAHQCIRKENPSLLAPGDG